MITTVLFDLDGTLLPMDNDVFTKAYFKHLSAFLAPHGYESGALINGVWAGTAAMVKNDGTRTNEDAFWEKFAQVMGEGVFADKPTFEKFYATDFAKAREVCGFSPLAREAVSAAKAKGLRVSLATNPIFPAIATESRIRWAGLEPDGFDIYTTYENSCFCKPSPAYYTDIAKRLNVAPENCIMVGNDVTEDMIAQKAGMQVFLLTDNIINRKEEDISAYPHGGFNELIEYIKSL